MSGSYYDVHEESIAKSGEELCGDQVRIHRGDARTTIVLSDGLGSGVKANILATLTAEIIINMLKQDCRIEDVIETVICTLPICRERRIAYATFTILQIDHRTRQFEIINFDNPAPFYLQNGTVAQYEETQETIMERRISRTTGLITRGDFIGIVSDGVIYAGLGGVMNLGWGWKNVAAYIQENFPRGSRTARSVVQRVMAKTRGLYGDHVGDDATLVGVLARERKSVMVFTGPPLDKELDNAICERLVRFDGRKIVCGGTTGNIVAEYIGRPIETVISTMTREVPPVGRLHGVDLLTEGIVTMSRAFSMLKECGCNAALLPPPADGAAMLASELAAADSVLFIVGGQINEWYQNPLLPKDMSLRKNLIREIADYLRTRHKEVTLEYC